MAALISFLVLNKMLILGAFTSVVTLASAVANFTKTDADNKVVAAVAKFVDFLALNFKK